MVFLFKLMELCKTYVVVLISCYKFGCDYNLEWLNALNEHIYTQMCSKENNI